MKIADAAARECALDPSKSFAVAAPAGSGKTELLTQRVLRLLATVEEPEEILCMTFTRKAAGEMKQRLLSALNSVSQSDVNQSNSSEANNSHQQVTYHLAKKALARDQEKNWQLLDNPNRLRIQTIDGFCLNLAQQLAVESRFGDYAEPVNDPTPLYREAIATLLLPSLEQQNPLGKAIGTLLRHLDNDLNKLEQLLINLLGKREQWLGQLFQSRGARNYLESFLNEVIEETLSEAQHLLLPYGSDLALLADYAASQLPHDKRTSPINHCLEMVGLPENNLHFVEQWQGLCELLLTKENDWRKAFNKNIGFPTETDTGDKAFAKAQKQAMAELLKQLQAVPGLLETLQNIRYLPPDHYDDTQWEVLDALALLLPNLSAQLSLLFQQQKVCDFTEITLAALRALGSEDEPTDLALKLDYQIHHILTDEFQDTSSVQFELLRRLTSEWQPDDGRSLFIVGDAMQSLYSFRNANVGLFLEARTLPLGNIQLEPLDLQVNFRSQAGIIDWVNQVFPQVFPAIDNISRGAVSYSPAIAFHPPYDTTPVSIDAFVDYPSSKIGAKAEAEHVTDLVSNARRDDPEGSIAILVRNRTHLTEILESLQQAGLHCQATDIDPLGKRMAVVDLMSLTRALLSPADRIAWLSILRAPWCGLDLHDLFQVATYQAATYQVDQQPTESKPPVTGEKFPLLLENIFQYEQIPSLSDDGKNILARVSHTLKQGWQQRYRKPLRSWIEGIWNALGGTFALRSDNAYKQCQQYLELLEQYESSGTLDDWPSFEKAVQSLYAKADKNADPNLHVMTIHKAKGLEFDTVIIPALNRKPRGDDKQLMLWQERVGQDGQNQLIIGPLEQAGQETDPLFRYLQREQKLKGQLEKSRVLYVAATRAIKKLHLSYTIDKDSEPTKNSLLESLWPALNPDSVTEKASLNYHYCPESDQTEGIATANSIPTLATLNRLPTNWQDSQTSTTQADTTKALLKTRLQTNKELQQKTLQENLLGLNITARHTGTVLHRILRQLVIEGIDNWKIGDIKHRQQFWEIQLQQLGVTAVNAPLALLERAIINCLKDETARWLLNHEHSESQYEYALGYIAANGEPKTAVVDRCFISETSVSEQNAPEKTQWIIDYKLAEPSTDETKAAFIQRETNQYRGQLGHYAELFKHRNNLPVKTALYFPLISHLEII